MGFPISGVHFGSALPSPASGNRGGERRGGVYEKKEAQSLGRAGGEEMRPRFGTAAAGMRLSGRSGDCSCF